MPFLILRTLRALKHCTSTHNTKFDPSRLVVYLHTGTCARWIVSGLQYLPSLFLPLRCWSTFSSAPGRTSTGLDFSSTVLTGGISHTELFSFMLRISCARYAGKSFFGRCGRTLRLWGSSRPRWWDSLG